MSECALSALIIWRTSSIIDSKPFIFILIFILIIIIIIIIINLFKVEDRKLYKQ